MHLTGEYVRSVKYFLLTILICVKSLIELKN